MTGRPGVTIGYCDPSADEEVVALVRLLLGELLGNGTEAPLDGLLRDPAGRTVVIKPNMVRHFNPRASLEAVVTAPIVVRALAMLAREYVGPAGRVIVADSPQNDCDFEALLDTAPWRAFRDWSARSCPGVEVLDVRPEQVAMDDGIITARLRLPGDPLGESLIDLGEQSAFVGSGLDPRRLRGSDYDPSLTGTSHSDGRHAYAVCRTFLDADLLIVVPKVKTHKKVGLSLAMKNLVGIVGEKNCLPHHTAGFPAHGGDEYRTPSPRAVVRQWAVERARPLLARGRLTRVFRAARRIEGAALPEVVERSGNWWGNDTAWRMVIDLVSIVRRERLEARRPTLFLYEGLVVGENEGPLAPDPLDWGLLAAADDPVAGDAAVTRELGLDPERFPLLVEARARGSWSPGSPDAAVVHVGTPRPGPRPRLHPGWVASPQRATSQVGHG